MGIFSSNCIHRIKCKGVVMCQMLCIKMPSQAFVVQYNDNIVPNSLMVCNSCELLDLQKKTPN